MSQPVVRTGSLIIDDTLAADSAIYFKSTRDSGREFYSLQPAQGTDTSLRINKHNATGEIIATGVLKDTMTYPVDENPTFASVGVTGNLIVGGTVNSKLDVVRLTSGGAVGAAYFGKHIYAAPGNWAAGLTLQASNVAPGTTVTVINKTGGAITEHTTGSLLVEDAAATFIWHREGLSGPSYWITSLSGKAVDSLAVGKLNADPGVAFDVVGTIKASDSIIAPVIEATAAAPVVSLSSAGRTHLLGPTMIGDTSGAYTYMLDVLGTGRTTGAMTVGGGLTVGGAVSASGGLSVAGAASVGNGLTVTGAASVGNGLTVGGAASVGNGLTVTGALTANGGSTLGGNTSMTGNASITGGMTVKDGALTVNSVNGNVGIGTAAPVAPLHVFGDNASMYVGSQTAHVIMERDPWYSRGIVRVYDVNNGNRPLALNPRGGQVTVGNIFIPTADLDVAGTMRSDVVVVGPVQSPYCSIDQSGLFASGIIRSGMTVVGTPENEYCRINATGVNINGNTRSTKLAVGPSYYVDNNELQIDTVNVLGAMRSNRLNIISTLPYNQNDYGPLSLYKSTEYNANITFSGNGKLDFTVGSNIAMSMDYTAGVGFYGFTTVGTKNSPQTFVVNGTTMLDGPAFANKDMSVNGTLTCGNLVVNSITSPSNLKLDVNTEKNLITASEYYLIDSTLILPGVEYTFTYTGSKKRVRIYLVGGGGGGGSGGALNASNTGNRFDRLVGGGGGGSGYISQFELSNISSGARFQINLGAGGNGGAAVSANNTGRGGSSGGTSKVNYLSRTSDAYYTYTAPGGGGAAADIHGGYGKGGDGWFGGGGSIHFNYYYEDVYNAGAVRYDRYYYFDLKPVSAGTGASSAIVYYDNILNTYTRNGISGFTTNNSNTIITNPIYSEYIKQDVWQYSSLYLFGGKGGGGGGLGGYDGYGVGYIIVNGDDKRFRSLPGGGGGGAGGGNGGMVRSLPSRYGELNSPTGQNGVYGGGGGGGAAYPVLGNTISGGAGGKGGDGYVLMEFY